VAGIYVERGQPVALEGRQVVLEFPADAAFHADALGQAGRQRQVETILAQVLGGDLTLRVSVGEGSSPVAPADEQVVDLAGPAPEPEALDIDPATDQGQELGSDADTRAVADLVAREFGGQVRED
jgi:hypothetical protein